MIVADFREKGKKSLLDGIKDLSYNKMNYGAVSKDVAG